MCSCNGNHGSNRKVLKMYGLTAGEMSETSAIAESSDSVLFVPLHGIASRRSHLSHLPLDACACGRPSVRPLRTDRSSSFPDLLAKTAPCTGIE
jgi:hypothetical protein